MHKNNPGNVTSRHQRRAEAAIKRREKRKAARAVLLAPYRKMLTVQAERIAELQKKLTPASKETTDGQASPV